MRNYEYRHNQKNRKRQHAYEVIRHCWGVNQEEAITMSNRLADNLAVCSCYACRNPRHLLASKKDKLSIQERRAFQKDSETPF